MDMAIANSSIYPEQIDYINAHGPSDREIDAEEVRCIKSLFGNHANRLKIASIKGVTGNPLSAAGALQVGCCAMAFRKQQIPLAKAATHLCVYEYLSCCMTCAAATVRTWTAKSPAC